MATRISVIIPNHNYGDWIDEAISSAVTTYEPEHNIVVIDDGSTDHSWEVICNVCNLSGDESERILHGRIAHCPIMAYRFTEAGGPSRARNRGIQLIAEETDLFGFLDSDDIYLPGKIGESVKLFETDKIHIGAIYTDYITQNAAGTRSVQYKEPFSRARLLEECIVHSACMVNKLALLKCGGYDELLRTCEDYDLWLRISENFVILHIPEPLMIVRVGQHSSSVTVERKLWEENWSTVMRKMHMRYINSE